MLTKIIKINPKNPEKNKIKIAASLIKNGKLVAFPTETVYGLGANALNPKAIKKIFKVKGRPSDNPLIIHIYDFSQLEKLTSKIPKYAVILAKKFWPGPLTLVLPKSKAVPKEATGGLQTVAVRMPKNKIALELLKKSNVPIAAPSANISGKPSPTKAEHVYQDLNKKIPLIIDGGITKIGIESTVIDVTKKIPKILRPGVITKEQIIKTIKTKVSVASTSQKKAISPGMKYKHYSPEAKIILAKNLNLKKLNNIVKKHEKEKIALISFNKNLKTDLNFHPSTIRSYSKKLYWFFREADKRNIDLIIAEEVEKKGLGLALMNRLKKASGKKS